MENWLLVAIEYLVRAIVVVLGTYVFAYIRKYKLEKWVKIAVQAAEMIYKGSGLGEQKKQDVINFITSKFKVSKEELDRLIEAAVFEMNRLKENEKA